MQKLANCLVRVLLGYFFFTKLRLHGTFFRRFRNNFAFWHSFSYAAGWVNAKSDDQPESSCLFADFREKMQCWAPMLLAIEKISMRALWILTLVTAVQRPDRVMTSQRFWNYLPKSEIFRNKISQNSWAALYWDPPYQGLHRLSRR